MSHPAFVNFVLTIAIAIGLESTSHAFDQSQPTAATTTTDPQMKQKVKAAIDHFMTVNDGDGKEHVLRDLGEYGEVAAAAAPAVIRWYEERWSRGDPVMPGAASPIMHSGSAIDPFVEKLASTRHPMDASVAFEIAKVRGTFSAEWFRELLAKADEFDRFAGDRTQEARIGFVARFS